MTDGSETESTQTRYPYTNDAAALILVCGSLALIAAGATGYADLAAVPQDVRLTLWVASGLVAVAWLFGGGAVAAASKIMGGGE